MYLTWDLLLNSKLFLILFLFGLLSCGVKNDPVIPKNTPLPSVLNNYPDIEVEKPLNESKKR